MLFFNDTYCKSTPGPYISQVKLITEYFDILHITYASKLKKKKSTNGFFFWQIWLLVSIFFAFVYIIQKRAVENYQIKFFSEVFNRKNTSLVAPEMM